MHSGDIRLTLRQIVARRAVHLGRGPLKTLDDPACDVVFADPACVNGPLHLGDAVPGQALQHADVLPRPRLAAVLCFQVLPQLGEDGRQLPAAIDVGMVEGGRLRAQAGQVVEGIEDLLAFAVAARVAGHALTLIGDDINVVDVGLDGDLAKGESTRHAVAVVVEAYGLVLVDLRRPHDTRIEAMRRQ